MHVCQPFFAMESIRIQGIYTDTEVALPPFKIFKYDGKYYKNIYIYMKHFVKIVRKLKKRGIEVFKNISVYVRLSKY